MNTVTCEQLKQLLKDVPDNAQLLAYEGEVNGLQIDVDGKFYGFIRLLTDQRPCIEIADDEDNTL